MPEEIDPRRKYKDAYMHVQRGGGDMFTMAVGHNLVRMRKQKGDPSARGPIPVVAGDAQTLAWLTAERSRSMAEYAALYNGAERNIVQCIGDLDKLERYGADWEGEYWKAITSRHRDRVQQAEKALKEVAAHKQQLLDEIAVAEGWRDRYRDQALAARATRIVGPEILSTLDPRDTKIYEMGHGAAGEPALTCDLDWNLWFSLRKVAQGYKAAGLHREFRSFRLPACGSADAKTRHTWADDPPARSGPWLDRRTAPAQCFADELRRAGFVDPQVTGYQGLGIQAPPGKTAARALSDTDKTLVRQSHVSKVFTPRKKRLLPCL